MTKSSKTDEQRAAISAVKEQRARDAALAMRDYQAEHIATLARTERLRAMRLARDEQVKATPPVASPKKKAARKAG